MTTQDELQSILKERYGINKNISQALSAEEYQRILTLLSSESSTAKLVDSATNGQEKVEPNLITPQITGMFNPKPQ